MMKAFPEIRVALCAVLVTAALSACARSTEPRPEAQRASDDASVVVTSDTLRITLGTQASADGGKIAVSFLERVNDSRCAANVVCVWAGDAEVRLRVRAGEATVVTPLHTTLEPMRVSVGKYTLHLMGLTPYPGSGDQNATPIAHVVVSRGK
jgi:hypothetical protein